MLPFSPLTSWADHLENHAWPRGSVVVYEQTASTQAICRGRMPGFVCVAGRQTLGRGRLGRVWSAPADTAITLSFVAPAGLSHGLLSLAIPVALCRALEPWLIPRGLIPAVKWPNDVCVHGRKLAGILIEVENGLPTVGIGLNVLALAEDFPSELQEKATSLAALGALDPNADRLPVLAALLQAIDTVLRDLIQDPTHISQEWKDRCTGFPAAFRCEGQIYRGTVLDVDANQGLVLRLDSGEITHLPAERTTTEI